MTLKIKQLRLRLLPDLHKFMKKSSVLLALIVLLSCENKKTEDFTDRAISLMLENPKGESIELPDLYPERIRIIPSEKEEKLILAEKLQARGFEVKNIQRGASPLAGVRFVTLKLSKQNCICEVTKTYHSTEFVSEYKATERIKCY